MNRKSFLYNTALFTLGASRADILKTNQKTVRNAATELVVNAGIAGNTTKNLLKRIDTDCLAYHPDLVIMMIGTNDMVNGKYVPIDQFEINLNNLADKIQQSGSRLLMMAILPFYEPYLLTRHPAAFFQPEGPSGRRKAVNEVIKKVAGEKGASFFDPGVLFEKIGKIGTGKDSLLRNAVNSGRTDGVHPTPNGYRFLALAVSEFIEYHELPSARIVCFGDSITKGDGSIEKESYPAYLKKLLQ